MDLTKKEREGLWNHLTQKLEHYYTQTRSLRVAPQLDKKAVVEYVEKYKGQDSINPETALNHVLEGLTEYAVHTPHPMYYGLYNPRSSFAGIMADAITATLNPQLAAWSHAPFAAEVENYLIREFGRKFGFPDNQVDGNFTSGGAEANLTAFLCAMNHHYPEYAANGLQSLTAQPVVYCSKESHHSVTKAASITGLGINSIREIETNKDLKLNPEILASRIQADIDNGCHPFLIIASMGTTGSGAIDPIKDINTIARKHNCWLHADAAYGGAVVLNNNHSALLEGISLADSITFDAHKWLSVPMAASIFLTRHPDILGKTFRITTDYMPKDAADLEVTDPFTHSIQWSRRFIGLKVYLSLLMYGWSGFSDLIDHQIKLAELLREKLQKNQWEIYNSTMMPVVCFGRSSFQGDDSAAFRISRRLLASGKTWISVYQINSINTLRACITNYQTTESDIYDLVALLEEYAPQK